MTGNHTAKISRQRDEFKRAPTAGRRKGSLRCRYGTPEAIIFKAKVISLPFPFVAGLNCFRTLFLPILHLLRVLQFFYDCLASCSSSAECRRDRWIRVDDPRLQQLWFCFVLKGLTAARALKIPQKDENELLISSPHCVSREMS